MEQLWEWGVDISSGQLNRILIEDKELFRKEKDTVLSVGLKVSSYINVDDTGARHAGKNGYCTHIGNEFFAWFQSTESKSRINFLKLLRAGHLDYVINEDALEYMSNQGFAKYLLSRFGTHWQKNLVNKWAWEDHLKELGITNARHIRIATEGALLGSVLSHGLPKSLVIVSDDAGQFHILTHALCWIHAERAVNKLIPRTEEQREVLEEVRHQIWEFYNDLKNYKARADEVRKSQLQARFDDIFTQRTCYTSLNMALERIYKNKDKLLLVLERPDIPLHNNLSESDIREYVKRRKVSGSTRSELGRSCRDTFTSLKKTCRKLGISFWHYLNDRLSQDNCINNLSELIYHRATAHPDENIQKTPYYATKRDEQCFSMWS
ncbi:MAG: transposase [Pseudomonadota bacterium]|nr:transposase [Pseudomonadota bacterium]